MIDTFMTADQVAKSLRVEKSTIYSWTSGKKISFVKIGGQLLFRESDINEFIKKNTHKAI